MKTISQLYNRLVCLFRGHVYYDCICGRCGKHLFDAPIKKFFKRIICLFKGHKWYIKGVTDKIGNDDGVVLIDKCSRCGKITEVEVL